MHRGCGTIAAMACAALLMGAVGCAGRGEGGAPASGAAPTSIPVVTSEGAPDASAPRDEPTPTLPPEGKPDDRAYETDVSKTLSLHFPDIESIVSDFLPPDDYAMFTLSALIELSNASPSQRVTKVLNLVEGPLDGTQPVYLFGDRKDFILQKRYDGSVMILSIAASEDGMYIDKVTCVDGIAASNPQIEQTERYDFDAIVRYAEDWNRAAQALSLDISDKIPYSWSQAVHRFGILDPTLSAIPKDGDVATMIYYWDATGQHGYLLALYASGRIWAQELLSHIENESKQVEAVGEPIQGKLDGFDGKAMPGGMD